MQRDAHWYAIRVKSNFERTSSSYLESLGYEVFLAMYSALRNWSDRKRVIELPLFPGYTFCRFDANLRSRIVTAPGVVNIVGIGRTPAPVDESEIAAVRTAAMSLCHCEPWPYLSVGTRVRINEGPLKGLEGILIEERNQRRLVVSVTLLQRSVAVELSRAQLSLLQNPVQDRTPQWDH